MSIHIVRNYIAATTCFLADYTIILIARPSLASRACVQQCETKEGLTYMLPRNPHPQPHTQESPSPASYPGIPSPSLIPRNPQPQPHTQDSPAPASFIPMLPSPGFLCSGGAVKPEYKATSCYSLPNLVLLP